MNRFVVSVPWAMPLIRPGPYVPVARIGVGIRVVAADSRVPSPPP